eukprot:scaffold38396_cov65-Phaeocystis_antarctica.AAC.6
MADAWTASAATEACGRTASAAAKLVPATTLDTRGRVTGARKAGRRKACTEAAESTHNRSIRPPAVDIGSD